MDLNFKKELIEHLHHLIQYRISDIKLEINDANESKKNESKSSAGDKYETSREMIQQNLNNLEVQLNKYTLLLKTLHQINFNSTYSKIEYGSIVQTNENLFIIGIPLGKIEFNNKIFHSISLDSPIGKALKGKKSNEKILFLNKTIHILHII